MHSTKSIYIQFHISTAKAFFYVCVLVIHESFILRKKKVYRVLSKYFFI